MSLTGKKKQCERDVRWEIIQTRVNQSIKKMVFNDDKVYNLEASRCDSCFYVHTQLLNLKKKALRSEKMAREKKTILTAAMINHRSVNNFTLIRCWSTFPPELFTTRLFQTTWHPLKTEATTKASTIMCITMQISVSLSQSTDFTSRAS